MNRVLLVWFAFLGVFAAGAVTGGMIAQRMAKTVIQRRASEQFTEQQFKRVSEQLELTEDQRARIRPIITHAAGEIQLRRRENLAILEKMESDIRSQLTDSQLQKFDDLRERQRENERSIQHWLREQRRHRMEFLSNPEQKHGAAGEAKAATPTLTPTETPSAK
jgi:Spy/CpxP family protein refolding chaperone